MKKSARAKLATRNLGTSILDLAKQSTTTTVPLPRRAKRKTIQTPQRKVHQSNKSRQGMNGPKKKEVTEKMKILTKSIDGLKQT